MHQFAFVVLTANIMAITACANPERSMMPAQGIVESVVQVDRDASRVGNTPTVSGVPGTLQGYPAAGQLSQPGAATGSSSADGVTRMASRSTNHNAYEIRVTMEDGTRRVFTQEAAAFSAGDPVRVTAEGRLLPR